MDQAVTLTPDARHAIAAAWRALDQLTGKDDPA